MTKANRKRNALFVLLFIVLALAAAFIFWSRLHVGADTDETATVVTSADYFSLLRAARDDVRRSDGHRAAEFERLIASGNPDDLILFSRERFDVVPGGQNLGWQNATRERRWGSRALLRGGTGTPREIADLLADGLQKMGFAADVVGIDVDGRTRPFTQVAKTRSITVDSKSLSDSFPANDLHSPPILADTHEFWQRVVGAVPAEAIAVEPFDGEKHQFPTVRLVQDDTTRVANLWGASPAPYVDLPTVNVSRSGDVPMVAVKLQVAMADNPNEPATVAEARWSTEMIAGRQIVASFAPMVQSAEELLATPPKDFSGFVPLLRVVGADLDHASAQTPTISGTPFSLNGMQFGNDSGNWLPKSGRVTSGGVADQIESLRIEGVISGHYPWVGLDVSALDADGRTVTGVPLDQFRTSIDSSSASTMLESNTPDSARILFLLDVSSSVADEFRGAAATDFVQTIARDVRSTSSSSRFRIGYVSGSGASLLNWRDDPEVLAADMQHFGQGSRLWSAAGDVAKTNATLVVFITDGHAADRDGPIDAPDPASERLIRAGPPFVVVGAVQPGNEPGRAVEAISDLSGGVVVSMDDPQRVTQKVLEVIRERLTPYRFWIRADGEKAQHMIRVALADRDIESTATLNVPTNDVRSPLPGPVGLYLVIDANGIRSERTLAGYPYRSRLPLRDSHAIDSRLGLFGEYTVFAEAGSPGSAQILDDLISARVSWEDVIEADNLDDAISASAQAWNLPRSAFTFSMPLPQATNSESQHRVIDYGLRWWIHTRRRVFHDGTEYEQESTDILPNTRFFSTDPNPEEAFEQTVLASAYLTDVEAAYYSGNALTSLGERALLFTGKRAPTEASKDELAAFDELTSGWHGAYEFLMPDPIDAGVAVDMRTGTATGLLLAPGSVGKGGGITEMEVNARFDQVDRILSAAGRLGGGPAAWATLQRASMKKLHFATILIMRMDAPDLLDMVRDEACSTASGAVDAAAEAGIRAATGRAGSAILDALDYYDDAAETVGMGGIDPSIPIPGCE